MLELTKKIEGEAKEEWYTCFYHQLRREMDGYFWAKKYLRIVEKSTDCEEDFYDEAV